MKKLILSAVVLILSSASYAGPTKEMYPTIKVTDALGTHFVSIKNFCMTKDHSQLSGIIRYCSKAMHMGRGNKRCSSRATLRRMNFDNSFTYKAQGPRGQEIVSTYSYDKVLDINVVDLRSMTVLDTFSYEIPYCK